MPERSPTSRRGGAALPLSTLVTLATSVVLTGPATTPAYADTVGKGTAGQRLTVAKTTGLSRSGETVRVSGTGYDTRKGIYVAFCVDNGPGQAPSPCGGGIDTTGNSGASHWISSNPPSYGEGLAIPYGPGGSFSVQLKVSPAIGDVDCTVRRCAVVTRADHTRTADRSQDVRVPITFAKPPGTAASPPPPSGGQGTAGGGATAHPDGPGSRTGASTAGATGGSATAGPGASADAGAVIGPAGTAGPAAASVTRVSDTGTAGRWWRGALVLLAALLVLLVLLRIRRRRGAR